MSVYGPFTVACVEAKSLTENRSVGGSIPPLGTILIPPTGSPR